MRRWAALAAVLSGAEACTNLLISARASETGSPQIAYTSDEGAEFGALRHYPAADHPPGTMRDIWDQDSGRYLGQIPEAAHTYNVVGYTGGMNEHQLAIGETTFGGLKSLQGQEGALVDYETLMTLALQRARTAREAIRVMDELVQKYGYASSGESFSIADTKEVWIMEMIGKGPGEKGAVWVARLVPDGWACSHANQARIRTWPRDTSVALWADDVVSFAKRKGLYPADADPLKFSFSDTFAPVDFFGARMGEARAWSILKELSDDPGFGDRYLDYAQGYNVSNRMPLFVRTSRAVAVNESMWLMRNRFTGTWFDERNDVGAGPFHAEYRQRPLLWHAEGKTYVNERTVGVQQNAWHMFAMPRADVPAPIGGILWFGVDDQSLSVRTPVYASSTAVPSSWQRDIGRVDRTHFSFNSADWVFNLVSNFAYSRWSAVYPVVQERIVATENAHWRGVFAADKAAIEILKNEGAAAATAYLTNFSVTTAEKLVQDWLVFFGELFARFRDGFDCQYQKPAGPKDIPAASCAEPGYDDAWRGRIVADAGAHYRGRNASGPDLVDARLHDSRRKHM
eukprot:TRINITY_DN23419_c0_g1_i1.p1 TRINITY_DN23419_c0_g1~~TRINITY_DN23419_c0_g1_i1.p1  ORF type:complete len:570 (+),score=157.83 TRINITY_DN23419_c0_g1_i1:77-1786(+)